jgi:hypothetical protein
MNGAGVEGGRFTSGRANVPRVLLLSVFGAATFFAGRLWSLREVSEAQRQSGLAEQGRLELQAELIDCRNASLLQRSGGEASPGGRVERQETDASGNPTAASARANQNVVGRDSSAGPGSNPNSFD